MSSERLAYIMEMSRTKGERTSPGGSYTEGILELLQVRKAAVVISGTGA